MFELLSYTDNLQNNFIIQKTCKNQSNGINKITNFIKKQKQKQYKLNTTRCKNYVHWHNIRITFILIINYNKF